MSAAAIAATILFNSLQPVHYDVQQGVATYYTFEDYGYGPLYAHPYQRYDPYNDLPWCAVNVAAYLSGAVQPGDKLVIEFIDHDEMLFLEAWDAGPFDEFYIEDFQDQPILVDVPEHLWPLQQMSARIRVINVSRLQREGISYVN